MAGTVLPLVYTEAAPVGAASAFVECYWSIRGDAGAQAVQNRVLPDGCMDIIFALDGATEPHPAYVVGAMRRALVVAHSGSVDLLGIRFRPGRAASVLGVPATELTGGLADLAAFWPRDSWVQDALASIRVQAPEAGSGALAGAATAERNVLSARAAVLDGLLLARGAEAEPDRLALAALGLIGESQGNLRVRELEQRLGTSERTLGRRFAAAVGLSPKETSRVVRFLSVARQLDREPRAGLARVAAAAGYADQAHLTRDFGELAGITPAAFVREPSITRRHGI